MKPSSPSSLWRARKLLSISLAGLLLPLPGLTRAADEPAPVPTPNKMAAANDLLDDQRKIAIGDRLTFRIIEDRDDSRVLVVLDSGETEVPYVGRVPAAGRTCRELAMAIRPLLEKDYYYQATVMLSIDTSRQTKGKIYLAGQLRSTGPQEIPSDETYTLSKAILRAGGFSDFADKRKVRVIRRASSDSKESKTIYVDMVEVIEKGKMDKDIVLQADDYIFVDQKLVNF